MNKYEAGDDFWTRKLKSIRLQMDLSDGYELLLLQQELEETIMKRRHLRQRRDYDGQQRELEVP